MFHYRWALAPTSSSRRDVLPRWGAIDRSEAEMRRARRPFRAADRAAPRRRIERVTAPVIEASYRRLLALLMRGSPSPQPFVLGRRPAASDFGVFGQLTQLVKFDPTPMAIARAQTPRVVAWSIASTTCRGSKSARAAWIARDGSRPGVAPAALRSRPRLCAVPARQRARSPRARASSAGSTDGRGCSSRSRTRASAWRRCATGVRRSRPGARRASMPALDGTGCECCSRRRRP